MALAIVISRCTPKLSHWSNCTSSYLILFFHTIPYSPRKIFGYWKDFLSVTRKASVFSGSILSPLLSNQRYDRNSIWGCSFQQVVWKLLPHYRLYLTIWICKLCSCVGFKPFARSLKFFESEKLFVLDHAGTLFLSLEWLYLWNQALHNVLDSIGIAQDGGLSFSNQSLGNYFESETSWVISNPTNQVLSALKSASLYALPQSCFSCFPCLIARKSDSTEWRRSTSRCQTRLNLPENAQMGIPIPPAVFPRYCAFQLLLVPVDGTWSGWSKVPLIWRHRNMTWFVDSLKIWTLLP